MISLPEEDQDGRVGKHAAQLPHKHSKNTSTCGAILTENKLETERKTQTTKVVRKIHTELGRKGREAIRSGPASLGRDKKEVGDYTGSEMLPGEWVV